MLIKLAWRNLWRNKRRTLITCASIFFAVVVSTSLYSVKRGTWNHFMDSFVNSYIGYGQIHGKDYWAQPNINNLIFEDSIYQKLGTDKNLVPRLEGVALAINKDYTEGAFLVGINPQKENELTNVAMRVKEGSYLESNSEQNILVAEGLATYMDISLGDTLVLLSQGYHGANSIGKYPVKGIVSFGLPILNEQTILMPLEKTQWFFDADNLLTSVVLNLKQEEAIDEIMAKTKMVFDSSTIEVLSWQEMIPDLLLAQELDYVGFSIILGILYLLVAFSILGTIIMTTNERQKEFSLLMALGMQRFRQGLMVYIEIALLAIIGTTFGLLVMTPIVYYVHANPIQLWGSLAHQYKKFGMEAILVASNEWQVFVYQALIVLVITLILALYPLYHIWRSKPIVNK